MRARSAITRGRSSGRSMLRVRLPAPPRKVLRARSTSAATSAGSGDTESVPVTMRPWSSRSPIRPRIWSACSSMTRKNCSISAGSAAGEAPSTVAVEPLIEMSGVRSSCLTMPRNSARSRSISASGARSCSVTTTDSIVPSAERIGVELTSVVTLRPSGTDSVISSARTVSPLLNCCASGNSRRATSRPSARRHVTRPEQLLGRAVGEVQIADDPQRLPVERHGLAALAVEDHDAHRRGLDQRLQVGPRTALVAVRARAGDRGRRLGGEQDEHFLVGAAELLASLLLGEKENADVGVAVAHRGALQRFRPHQVEREPESPLHRRAGPTAAAGPAGRLKCLSSRGPSGQAAICCFSSGVNPEVTKSSMRCLSSTVTITP